MKDRTLLPYMAEGDQTLVATGVGYRKGGHKFDLALARGFFDDRDVTDNQMPLYNGKYEFSSHVLALSYACEF